MSQALKGHYDPLKAAADYRDLGPLTRDDVEHLDGLTTDQRRRTCLANWYGTYGGWHAWTVYRAIKHRQTRDAQPAATHDAVTTIGVAA